MPFVHMWVTKLPLQDLIDQRAGASLQAHLKKVVATALHRDSRRAVRKLCELNSSGEWLFRHEPPLIWRYAELPSDVLFGVPWRQGFDLMFDTYLKSVRPELRHLLSHFRLSDAALKAVGVGSVGTRCAIGVFVGDLPEDVLVLQSKQAGPSVLAPYIGQPVPEHQGKRVVLGQRLMQTASDAFGPWPKPTPGAVIGGPSAPAWASRRALRQRCSSGPSSMPIRRSLTTGLWLMRSTRPPGSVRHDLSWLMFRELVLAAIGIPLLVLLLAVLAVLAVLAQA